MRFRGFGDFYLSCYFPCSVIFFSIIWGLSCYFSFVEISNCEYKTLSLTTCPLYFRFILFHSWTVTVWIKRWTASEYVPECEHVCMLRTWVCTRVCGCAHVCMLRACRCAHVCMLLLRACGCEHVYMLRARASVRLPCDTLSICLVQWWWLWWCWHHGLNCFRWCHTVYVRMWGFS